MQKFYKKSLLVIGKMWERLSVQECSEILVKTSIIDTRVSVEHAVILGTYEKFVIYIYIYIYMYIYIYIYIF